MLQKKELSAPVPSARESLSAQQHELDKQQNDLMTQMLEMAQQEADAASQQVKQARTAAARKAEIEADINAGEEKVGTPVADNNSPLCFV